LDDFEFDVFISHNRADKPWVRDLAARIEQERWNGRPFRVFFDEWDIEPGENIPAALERALANSRKIALVLSPEASHSAWVEMERTICTMFDPSNRRRRLIPLLRRGSESDIPALVRPFKYLDFRRTEDFEDRFSQLLCSLREQRLPRGAQSDKTFVKPTLKIGPGFRSLILTNANHKCSICHTQYDVDVFPIQPEGTKLEHDNFISLCPNCYQRARNEDWPPDRLLQVRRGWLAVCHSDVPLSTIRSDLESAYNDACRLSLSPDLYDIKRAIVRCRQVLHYDAFHSEAQILLDKLLAVDRRLEAEASRRDVRYHLTQAEVNSGARWSRFAVLAMLLFTIPLALSRGFTWGRALGILLPNLLIAWCLVGKWPRFIRYLSFWLNWHTALIHERGHLAAIYKLHPISNAVGKVLPWREYVRQLELEMDGRYVKGGAREALSYYVRTGKFPGIAVNHSRMHRDWFSSVEF
jgi:hypothetical protein